MQQKFLKKEMQSVVWLGPNTLTAYDLFLRAMQQFYLTTGEGVAETLRLAHRALELDPRFGLVAALSGMCHMRNVLWGYSTDPQFDRAEAVRLARLALRIDHRHPAPVAIAAAVPAV